MYLHGTCFSSPGIVLVCLDYNCCLSEKTHSLKRASATVVLRLSNSVSVSTSISR